MIISPLRYPGGKSRLYKKISQYFPKNINTMADLFFGGGSIGLNWLNDNKDHKLIIYDIDDKLMEFGSEVYLYPDGSKYHYLCNDYDTTYKIFHEGDEPAIFSIQTIPFLIRNKCSFNGLHHGTGSKKAFEQNFNISTFKRISKCHKLLQNVKLISNDTYGFFFGDNTDTDVFIYLDPPYLIPNSKKLYKYGDFDHKFLLEMLTKCKYKGVLSYNDSPEVREMYKQFNIYEIKANYSSTNNNGNKNKNVTELVITNFINE